MLVKPSRRKVHLRNERMVGPRKPMWYCSFGACPTDSRCRAARRLNRVLIDDGQQVRRALPLIPPIATAIGESRGSGGATEGAKAYLEELRAYRSANFPSTEEQDGELLR